MREDTNEARLAEMYRLHHPFIWNLLRRLGVGPDEIEDAVQDVFVVAARRLSSFEGRSTLRTWLASIACRVAMEHLRRRSRSRRRDVGLSAPHSADFGEQVAAREGLRLLDEVLAVLSPEQRTVFVLAEIQEVPAPEIAKILDLGVNTVYSRLRLATERIHRAWERRTGRSERRA